MVQIDLMIVKQLLICKGQIVKTTLKKNQMGEFTLPNTKTYYNKSTLIQTDVFMQGQINQKQNRKENKEIYNIQLSHLQERCL